MPPLPPLCPVDEPGKAVLITKALAATPKPKWRLNQLADRDTLTFECGQSFWEPNMYAIAFDTLKYANRLKEAGVPDKQAEAHAEAQADVLDKNLNELATSRDLRDVEISIKRDLADLEARFEAKIEKLELRMTIRLGALIVGSMGLLFTALRFFPPLR